MRERGIMPSVVENAILNGQRQHGRSSSTSAYYDPVNNITVIINPTTGVVVTTHHGESKNISIPEICK